MKHLLALRAPQNQHPRQARSSRIAYAALFLLASFNVTTAAEIRLNIEGELPREHLVVMVFDRAVAFEDLRDPFKIYRPGPGEQGPILLSGLPAGEYAVLVYADSNQNGTLDRNFIGIPREALGFSNAYRPKGPPSYDGARFVLTEGETSTHQIQLARPLGRRGRVGVGVGVITRGNPYRQAEGSVLQVFPAVIYLGERFQILGPMLTVGLVGSGNVRLALQAAYRTGVYEEDDSPVLEGLGDRDDTIMAGPALQGELPAGFGLSLQYAHDVLDTIGGGSSSLRIARSFPWGRARFTPSAGLIWTDSNLANHDFGVPDEHARPGRPAYELQDTLSAEIGIGLFVELSSSLRLFALAGVEFLDREVTRSPIVDQSHVIKTVSALTYVF